MAFRIIRHIDQWPAPYPRVERKLSTAKERGWDRVGGYLLRKKEEYGEMADFMPQPGLQENFCACESNLIFLCGSMGMGKTYAFNLRQLYGISRPGYSGVMISVRLQDSSKGSSIFKDANELLGTFAGCEVSTSGYPTFVWPQWNTSFRLIHSNFNADNPQEWAAFQDYAKKVQAGFIAVDEATEIKQFKMFTFWFGRNRDASGLTPSMALSFNPDHDHWTTQMLKDAGYLTDDWYLRKDMSGVTRYFYVKGDTPESIIWGDTPEEVAKAAGIVITAREREIGADLSTMVKSFTMFTGETADNRELMAATKGQMLGNLHAMGGSLRDVNKGAYFGPIEKNEINVNRQMIHSLWENPIDNKDANIYATMDISKGGVDSDGCPCIIWKGLQIIAIEFFRKDTESEETHQLENFINGVMNRYNIPISNFAYDANGIGGLIEDFLKKGARGISGQGRVEQEYDENGNQVTVARYFNLRSQLLGKTEIMLKKGEISVGVGKDLVIPYGKKGQRRRLIDVLFDEINVFITTDRNGKIYYRKKEEYKDKFKSSPDLMDAISYRAIFELDTRERKQAAPQVASDAYDVLTTSEVSTWGRKSWNNIYTRYR